MNIPPPALVLGCNTLHGINVLSDWIEEQIGHQPQFHESGWSDGYKYNMHIHDGNGSGNGNEYGDNYDDEYYGDGCCGDGDGNGCGDGYYEHGYGSGFGNGCGSGYGSISKFYFH